MPGKMVGLVCAWLRAEALAWYPCVMFPIRAGIGFRTGIQGAILTEVRLMLSSMADSCGSGNSCQFTLGLHTTTGEPKYLPTSPVLSSQTYPNMVFGSIGWISFPISESGYVGQTGLGWEWSHRWPCAFVWWVGQLFTVTPCCHCSAAGTWRPKPTVSPAMPL